MNGSNWLRILVLLAGVGLIVLAMVDIFMTVLYVRAGTGPLSHRVASRCWLLYRGLSRRLPRRMKLGFLTYFGPLFVVTLTVLWLGLILTGFTLIAWPSLGRGVREQSGPTPTGFSTAFYYAGGSMSTVGSGQLGPAESGFKLMTVIDSVLGASMLTLTLTYVIQIYTALQSRNTLTLGLHHASGGTGDAAALLSTLGAGDDFSRSGSQVANIAAGITAVYESHHFYPVLIYFRFREPAYAVARGALLTMELVTLADAALDENRHSWFGRSAAVTQIREAGMHILSEFSQIYLPNTLPGVGEQSDAVAQAWRARYHAAIDFLRQAGISVTKDEHAGAERYVLLRRQWDSYVMGFARYLEHDIAEIDPGGAVPAQTARHREMPVPPLRATHLADGQETGSRG